MSDFIAIKKIKNNILTYIKKQNVVILHIANMLKTILYSKEFVDKVNNLSWVIEDNRCNRCYELFNDNIYTCNDCERMVCEKCNMYAFCQDLTGMCKDCYVPICYHCKFERVFPIYNKPYPYCLYETDIHGNYCDKLLYCSDECIRGVRCAHCFGVVSNNMNIWHCKECLYDICIDCTALEWEESERRRRICRRCNINETI